MVTLLKYMREISVKVVENEYFCFSDKEGKELLIDLSELSLETDIELYYDAKFGVGQWEVLDKITVSKFLGNYSRFK